MNINFFNSIRTKNCEIDTLSGNYRFNGVCIKNYVKSIEILCALIVQFVAAIFTVISYTMFSNGFAEAFVVIPIVVLAGIALTEIIKRLNTNDFRDLKERYADTLIIKKKRLIIPIKADGKWCISAFAIDIPRSTAFIVSKKELAKIRLKYNSKFID